MQENQKHTVGSATVLLSHHRNLTRLQRLYINNNNLEVLQNDTFTGLVSLTHLDLSNNKLALRTLIETPILPSPASAHPSTILGLPYAVTAWLQGRRGVRSVEDRDHSARSLSRTYLPFAGLESLEHLDLTSNGIRILTASQWWDLRQLTRLSLQNNNIQEWYEQVFSNLGLLSILDLSYNSLSIVTEYMRQDFSLPSLEVVDLSHNAFQCDCSLRSLAESVNTSIFIEFPSYRCSLEGTDMSFEEYITNVSCAPEPPPGQKPQESKPSRRLEIIVFSISLLLSAITTVTLYRKRW